MDSANITLIGLAAFFDPLPEIFVARRRRHIIL